MDFRQPNSPLGGLGLWNVYRFHSTEPVRFEGRIGVSLEHGHAHGRQEAPYAKGR